MLKENDVYYKLTILELVEKRGARKFWKCRCECGKEKIIEEGSITRKKLPTQSCGCLQKESVSEAVRLLDGEAAFKQLFGSYRSNAKRRNLEFNLSGSEFKFLTKQRCFYCNCEPKNIVRIFNGLEYSYNGIDRLNSNLGYFRENCVSCCSSCNRAKLDMSLDDFVNLVTLIYSNMKNKNLVK